MSYLKLHQPHVAAADDDGTDEPRILSFHLHARRLRRQQAGANLLARARLLRDNCRCPHCRYPVVEPLELEDGLLGRNRRPIPGTATIVGFHCHRCDAEWPAYRGELA